MRKLLFTLTLLVPSAALAGGYAIPNESARDLGLSQAAISNEDGAESVLLNPAALAGKDGLDLSVSGEMLVNRTDWSDPTLGSARMNPRYNFPPMGAISFGDHLSNGMAWGIGVGADVSHGGQIKWPDGWQGQEFIQSVDAKTYKLAAGGAFMPTEYIKIGGTYTRYQTREELHQEIDYLDHFGDADLGITGGRNSWSAGIELHAPKKIPLAIGVVYQAKGDANMSGDVHFSDVPPAFQSMLHDQKVTEKPLTVPAELHIGASYDVIENLRVMATFSMENWSTYSSDTFIGSDGFTVIVPRDYKDAYVYRLAGEWRHVPFLPMLTLRLGGLRSISNQPTDTVSPSLTDGDSWAISAGAGINVVPSLRIDVGFQHAFFDSVTATGNNVLPGTYKTMVDLVSIGLNWRLDLLGCGCKHAQ